jgi:hypothetical protein
MPLTSKVSIGTSVLTRDLVWCKCGRGLSLSGKWLFCPNCGNPIDQESYANAVEEAKANGASHFYKDPELVEQFNTEVAAHAATREQCVKLNYDLEKNKREWEEKEAACCPEDVGFPEYIATLQSQLTATREIALKLVEALEKFHDRQDCAWCYDDGQCDVADCLAQARAQLALPSGQDAVTKGERE